MANELVPAGATVLLAMPVAAIAVLQQTPNAAFAAEEFFKASISNETHAARLSKPKLTKKAGWEAVQKSWRMRNSETLAIHEPSSLLTALIAEAGASAGRRFLEFFTVNTRNRNTRAAYMRGPLLPSSAGASRGRGLTRSGASSRLAGGAVGPPRLYPDAV